MQAVGHKGSKLSGHHGCCEGRDKGVVLGKKDGCIPTVFHIEWPQDVQDLVCTKDNPDRPITKSDMEMVHLLLC